MITAVKNFSGLKNVITFDTLVNTPPEVLFRLAPPSVYRYTFFSKGCSNFILGRKYITCRPSNLQKKDISLCRISYLGNLYHKGTISGVFRSNLP